MLLESLKYRLFKNNNLNNENSVNIVTNPFFTGLRKIDKIRTYNSMRMEQNLILADGVFRKEGRILYLLKARTHDSQDKYRFSTKEVEALVPYFAKNAILFNCLLEEKKLASNNAFVDRFNKKDLITLCEAFEGCKDRELFYNLLYAKNVNNSRKVDRRFKAQEIVDLLKLSEDYKEETKELLNIAHKDINGRDIYRFNAEEIKLLAPIYKNNSELINQMATDVNRNTGKYNCSFQDIYNTFVSKLDEQLETPSSDDVTKEQMFKKQLFDVLSDMKEKNVQLEMENRFNEYEVEQLIPICIEQEQFRKAISSFDEESQQYRVSKKAIYNVLLNPDVIDIWTELVNKIKTYSNSKIEHCYTREQIDRLSKLGKNCLVRIKNLSEMKGVNGEDRFTSDEAISLGVLGEKNIKFFDVLVNSKIKKRLGYYDYRFSYSNIRDMLMVDIKEQKYLQELVEASYLNNKGEQAFRFNHENIKKIFNLMKKNYDNISALLNLEYEDNNGNIRPRFSASALVKLAHYATDENIDYIICLAQKRNRLDQLYGSEYILNELKKQDIAPQTRNSILLDFLKKIKYYDKATKKNISLNNEDIKDFISLNHKNNKFMGIVMETLVEEDADGERILRFTPDEVFSLYNMYQQDAISLVELLNKKDERYLFDFEDIKALFPIYREHSKAISEISKYMLQKDSQVKRFSTKEFLKLIDYFEDRPEFIRTLLDEESILFFGEIKKYYDTNKYLFPSVDKSENKDGNIENKQKELSNIQKLLFSHYDFASELISVNHYIDGVLVPRFKKEEIIELIKLYETSPALLLKLLKYKEFQNNNQYKYRFSAKDIKRLIKIQQENPKIFLRLVEMSKINKNNKRRYVFSANEIFQYVKLQKENPDIFDIVMDRLAYIEEADLEENKKYAYTLINEAEYKSFVRSVLNSNIENIANIRSARFTLKEANALLVKYKKYKEKLEWMINLSYRDINGGTHFRFNCNQIGQNIRYYIENPKVFAELSEMLEYADNGRLNYRFSILDVKKQLKNCIEMEKFDELVRLKNVDSSKHKIYRFNSIELEKLASIFENCSDFMINLSKQTVKNSSGCESYRFDIKDIKYLSKHKELESTVKYLSNLVTRSKNGMLRYRFTGAEIRQIAPILNKYPKVRKILEYRYIDRMGNYEFINYGQLVSLIPYFKDHLDEILLIMNQSQYFTPSAIANVMKKKYKNAN